jgi:hypothetical protein
MAGIGERRLDIRQAGDIKGWWYTARRHDPAILVAEAIE